MCVLFFSVIFRMVFVVHAHKGLVRGGRPDLKLFHQLYWVITCAWVAWLHTLYLKYYAKGTFPEGLKSGKFCLLAPLKLNGDGGQSLPDLNLGSLSPKTDTFQFAYILLVFPCICLIWLFYFKWRVKRFMNGLCPLGKMSCVGVYRRNVISFNQTLSGAVFWSFFGPMLDMFLQSGLTELEGIISRSTMFWIWNIKGFALNDLLFLFPFVLKIPARQKSFVKPSNFFVIYPKSLEPRRLNQIPVSYHKENTRIIFVKEAHNSHSSDYQYL